MIKNEELIARMKLFLEEGKEELNKLESMARDAESSAKEKYRLAIDELHEKREAAEVKIRELELAGEDALDDMKDEAEKVWSAFKKSIDAFHDYIDHS